MQIEDWQKLREVVCLSEDNEHEAVQVLERMMRPEAEFYFANLNVVEGNENSCE